jgi:hypothetical protein
MIKRTCPRGILSPLSLVGFALTALPFSTWGQVNLTDLNVRSGFIDLELDRVYNPPIVGAIYISGEFVAGEIVSVGPNEIFQGFGSYYFKTEGASSGSQLTPYILVTIETGDEYEFQWSIVNDGRPIMIFGPAEVRLLGRTGGYIESTDDPVVYKGTLRANYFIFSTESGNQYIPSNAVVIPEDATGSVEILMESSTDLINWVQANPGTYDSTHQKRFFRLRAVQN